MENNFLTKISHEIRTPLNAIIGFGYLCQQTRMDDQQRKYVTTMVDSAKELLDNFQEILDYSKLENDDFTITPIAFRLETVITDVVAVIKPRCLEKGLKLSTEIDEQVPSILFGDPKNISLVLLNLAGNAVKFTEKGSVHIAVKKLAGDNVCFSISDTGIGIAEDMYETIFLPFTQVDNSHTRAYGGTGLGLAVCTLLSERMGGKIEVGPNEDGGSIFNVTLPLKETTIAQAEEEGPLSGVRTLIVEQNQLNQQVLEAQYVALGLNVQCAHEGELALTMINDAINADHEFELVILSWQMPDMSGLEIAQCLKDSPHCPALILRSEFNLEEVQELAEKAGIDFIMPQNASAEIVQDIIVDILEERTAERAKIVKKEEEVAIGPPRILLVEDNEINQEIAYEVLSTANLTVDIANNGQEAVDAVAKEKYSLILMDIQMPIMDGLEATRRIREAGNTMPIVAMTAHAMLDDKDASMNAGMNAHLTKPLEPMALFAVINSFLPSSSGNSPVLKGAHRKDEVTAPRKDKLPDRIEGFNIIGGLATVGGNEELYAGLLKKFATRYATVNEDISNALTTNDIEYAVRQAHTVRGIAANLGAEELAKAAENLEKSIIHSPSMVTPHLRTLVVCLTNAVNAIRDSLGIVETNTDAEAIANVEDRLNPAEREHARYMLDQSISNMEMDWGHAGDTVKNLTDRLHGTKLENLLVQLLQAVEDFEVESAMELSKQIQEGLSSK